MGTGPGGTAAARAAVLLDDPHDEIGRTRARRDRSPAERKVGGVRVAQHAGVTGRVENCVTWVFTALVTAYAGERGSTSTCTCRTAERKTRSAGKTGIPGGLAFATKPELALEQVKRLVAGRLRVLWAAADEVYGRSATSGRAAGTRPVLRRHRSLRHHDHLRAEQGHPR